MKAPSFCQPLLRPRLVLYLLFLAIKIVGLHSADAGHVYPVQYKGVVGGNVSFYCPINEKKKLMFLYFQKGSDFLNGYHHEKPLTPKPNTKMDNNYTIMHMYGLKLSDSGQYECHYMYTEEDNSKPALYYLNVTAPVSKPVNTKNCNEGSGNLLGCYVKCYSHGGLPKIQMRWSVRGNISAERWKILNNTEVPSSMELVNISSTAYFNCSGGEVNVSCSVDGKSSDLISVCSNAPSKQPHHFTPVIIAAVCFLLLVVLVAVVLCVYTKRRTTELQGMSVQGSAEEGVVLTSTEGRNQGS